MTPEEKAWQLYCANTWTGVAKDFWEELPFIQQQFWKQKARGIKPLIWTIHGSKLYGTNTELSDEDFKGVHIPSADAIVLQRAEDVFDGRQKVSTGIKNSKDDKDAQSYSLQKFFSMLAAGDTVATEILFAPTPVFVDSEWATIKGIGHLLLNRQCKGFVGYCRRQAAKYGIKGSRMAACEDLVKLLSNALDAQGGNAKLEQIGLALRVFCEEHEFSSIEVMTSQAGTDIPHLNVVDRKMPFTARIKDAYDVYRKVFDNYGERARAAKANEGIDWKAVSHAVRVAEQAIELLTTGHITFPRPNAWALRQIKQGMVVYNKVAEELERLVEEVEAVAARSSLPEKSDQHLIDRTVLEYYYQATKKGVPA